MPSNCNALPANQRKNLLQTVIKTAITDFINDHFQMAVYAFSKFPNMKKLQTDKTLFGNTYHIF